MKMYSTKEAADVLKISVRTLKRWLKNGILKPVTTYDNGYNAYSEEQLKNFQKGMTQSEKNVVTRDTVFKPVTKNVTPFAKGMTQSEKNVVTRDIETYDKKNNVTPSEHMTFAENVPSLEVQKDPCKDENCTGEIAHHENEIAQVKKQKGATMVFGKQKPIPDEIISAIKRITPEELEQRGVITPAKTKANGRITFVCPYCGNGTGKRGDGLAVKEYDWGFGYTCFGKCGGETYNNFDLLAKYYGLDKQSDFVEICRRACSDFGIYLPNNNFTPTPARNITPPAAPKVKSAQEQALNKKYLENTQEDIIKARGNLRAFLNTCPANKFRGLKLETLDFFGCGFIENWTHPLTRAKIEFGIYKDDKTGKPKNPPPPSRRFIIPTYDGNHYNAVAPPEDRKNIPESLWKMHAGEKPTFGLQTLTDETEIIFAAEGEIDTMSIYQTILEIAGNRNTAVKSLGFIATLGLGSKSWYNDLDNRYSSRAKKPVVIWIGDGDHKDEDIKIKQELLKRGYPVVIGYLTDENIKRDANEVLISEGEFDFFPKIQIFLSKAGDSELLRQEVQQVQSEIQAAEKARADEEKTKQLISLPLSDMDNATRLYLMFGDIIRYNTTTENWGFYENGVWKFETSSNAALYPYTCKIADIIQKNIPLTDNNKHAVTLSCSWRKNKIQRNAIEMLKGVPQILIKQSDLDVHPNLINCKNGVVVDLKTGKYYPASPAFYLTQKAGANFNPNWKEDADHEVEKFLREILPNADYRECWLMWLAYCLTGEVNEEKFVFIKGPGGNGKGTLTKVALKMAGDYGCSFPIGGILARKNCDANAATTAINILENKRAGFGEEIPPNAKTDAAQIKILTGGDIVPARKNYGEYRNVNPSWKLTFSGNNDLQFPDANDYGIKRRLIVIPFEQDFTKNPNTSLKNELMEQSAIDYLFNKLVRLAPVWYKDGLIIPNAVKEVADDYLKAQDFIADFIDEYCERRPDSVISRKEFVERLREVYPRETPPNNQTLKEMLEKIDGVSYTRRNKGNFLKGIDWK